MSTPGKDTWMQIFFTPMSITAAGRNEISRAMVVGFSSNVADTAAGEIIMYIMYSAEQVARMVEENIHRYIFLDGFHEKVASETQEGRLPEKDTEDLPPMEMSQPSASTKMLSAMIFHLMTGQLRYVNQPVTISWTPGGKAQA